MIPQNQDSELFIKIMTVLTSCFKTLKENVLLIGGDGKEASLIEKLARNDLTLMISTLDFLKFLKIDVSEVCNNLKNCLGGRISSKGDITNFNAQNLELLRSSLMKLFLNIAIQNKLDLANDDLNEITQRVYYERDYDPQVAAVPHHAAPSLTPGSVHRVSSSPSLLSEPVFLDEIMDGRKSVENDITWEPLQIPAFLPVSPPPRSRSPIHSRPPMRRSPIRRPGTAPAIGENPPIDLEPMRRSPIDKRFMKSPIGARDPKDPMRRSPIKHTRIEEGFSAPLKERPQSQDKIPLFPYVPKAPRQRSPVRETEPMRRSPIMTRWLSPPDIDWDSPPAPIPPQQLAPTVSQNIVTPLSPHSSSDRITSEYLSNSSDSTNSSRQPSRTFTPTLSSHEQKQHPPQEQKPKKYTTQCTLADLKGGIRFQNLNEKNEFVKILEKAKESGNQRKNKFIESIVFQIKRPNRMKKFNDNELKEYRILFEPQTETPDPLKKPRH